MPLTLSLLNLKLIFVIFYSHDPTKKKFHLFSYITNFCVHVKEGKEGCTSSNIFICNIKVWGEKNVLNAQPTWLNFFISNIDN